MHANYQRYMFGGSKEYIVEKHEFGYCSFIPKNKDNHNNSLAQFSYGSNSYPHPS